MFLTRHCRYLKDNYPWGAWGEKAKGRFLVFLPSSPRILQCSCGCSLPYMYILYRGSWPLSLASLVYYLPPFSSPYRVWIDLFCQTPFQSQQRQCICQCICPWFVGAELCLESSCVVWECLFGVAYFWWCSVYYFVVRNNYCLRVVCDYLCVYLCSVSFYGFLCCCVWWCVYVRCVVIVVEDCLLF